jgi:hypothetical protein
MAYPAPIRICPVDEEILYSDTDSQYNVRPNGIENENNPVNRVTTYRYAGKLWQVCTDPFGDTNDSGLPGYFHDITFINYSSNGGATWAPNGSSLRSVGGKYFTDCQTITQLVGGKIWAFRTITEFDNPVSPSTDFTNQRRWVRVDYFDCDTLTWSEDVATNAGPDVSWPDGAFMSPDNYFNLSMALDVGAGVLVIGHDEAQVSSSVQAGVYSVFDTATMAWGDLNVKVFEFTVAIGGWSSVSHMAFDGTYLHFWSAAALNGDWGRLHRTLDAGFTLGSISDLFDGYPGTPSFPPTLGGGTGALPNSECFAIVFDGEVFLASHARRAAGTYPTYPWYLNNNVIICRCPAGVQNPTWTTWEVIPTAWDQYTTSYGEATYPFMVESGGSLYLLYGTLAAFTSLSDNQMHIRVQRYLGSGTWTEPEIVWDHKEWAGFGVNFGTPDTVVVKYSPIGNNGTAGTNGINWAASFAGAWYKDGPPDGGDSIYWFGYIPPSCCCANFAY